MASSNSHLVVRLASVLILLSGVTAAAVPRQSPQQDTAFFNSGLLRRLQRCIGTSCDSTHVFKTSEDDSTTTASDPSEEPRPIGLPRLGAANFDKLLWSPLRNVSVPLMVASERISQESAAMLEEIPSPVDKLLPSLRRNRTFLRPATEVGGLAAKIGDTGICDKEKTYKFTNMDQLRDFRAEAECIYARGAAPDRPPLGLWAGQVLEIINTDVFNLLAERIWTGKMSVKTQCKRNNHPENSDLYMLQNFVGSRMSLPAYMYTGTLRDPLSPGEYDDGKRHLFVDYVVDFAKVCPHPTPGNLNVGVINDPWPLNQMVDMVRKIGEQEDGGSILLGKSIIRDTWGFPETGDTTVAFWTVVNYDSEAWPIQEDSTLGPLEESFSWYHMSSTENIARLISLDEFVRNPTVTSLGTLNEIVRKPYGQENLGNEWDERHQEYLMAGNPDRPEDIISDGKDVSPSADDLNESLPSPLIY